MMLILRDGRRDPTLAVNDDRLGVGELVKQKSPGRIGRAAALVILPGLG
jgi:hypothetical protein